MTLDQLIKSGLLDDVDAAAVVGATWGDEGKGKITDFFAEWADVVARGTGGNNAGHTVVLGEKTYKFHLLPSGIIHPDKVNVLGNGMVIDLSVLGHELDTLEQENIPYNNLMISEDAHVILPVHITQDRPNTSLANSVGSTGRGIGPCYADKIARRGVMIRDLYTTDRLAGKVRTLLEREQAMRRGVLFAENDVDVSEMLPQERISHMTTLIRAMRSTINVAQELEKTMEDLKPLAERIRPFVKDTIAFMHDARSKNKKVLLEGAQGLLLSIEAGTYPYVTSSDCSINGTAMGVGLAADAVDLALSVSKFPYMTRVGAGPFPTEFGGKKAEEYCATETLSSELERFGIPYIKDAKGITYDRSHPRIRELLHSSEEFEQGVGWRLKAGEVGTTTGRLRRVGRLDLALLKHCVNINGPELVLTMADIAQGVGQFELGVGYEGRLGFTRNTDSLQKRVPAYKTFEGFDEDITTATRYEDLPFAVKKPIEFLERFTGGRVRILGIGPGRDYTIVRGQR